MYNLKKSVALALAIAGVSSCAVVAASAAAVEKGDFNHDGVINSNDAMLTLHASIAPELLSYTEFDTADYDDDGNVTAIDALMILRTSVDTTETVSTTTTKTNTQVSEMKGWSSRDIVEKVGPLFTEDQKKTGILASVSMAQFIVESGYGQSRLSLEANNCFGIKGWVEDKKRVDSPWDGVSVYTIRTREFDAYGNEYYTEANFRKYDCMEDSIEDHSRVLLTSTDGTKLRYASVVGVTDYKKACQIIFNGGYCTDPGYVKLLCDVIEYWDLTRFDVKNYTPSSSALIPSGAYDDEDSYVETITPQTLYRVRISWDDESTQLGAFQYIENAVECADNNYGYNVYDDAGNVVYAP